MKLLVATRSGNKLREIRAILREVHGLELVDLNDVGISPDPEEEGIEAFETFEENARAKAQYFRRRTGIPTIADDSGLSVDALDGRPGVHSKRFAPGGASRTAEARDRANNEYLLECLGDLELSERTARYVCVAVLDRGEATPGKGDDVVEFRGEAEGLILGRPRGDGGFGYDPLFFDRTMGRTFAELSPEEKHDRSHRGAAFRAFARYLKDSGVEEGAGDDTGDPR